MEQIINSEAFILALNIGAYYAGCALIARLKIKYISGLFIAIAVVASVIWALEIDYTSYEQGSRILNFLLGPSVVALGYVLHKHIGVIRQNMVAILVGITLGVVIHVVAIHVLLTLLGSDTATIYSLQPKSVTMPIAMALGQGNGAIIPLTVVAVIITGLFGSLIGAPVLRILRVRSAIARGAAMGCAAHGIGTARALEMGAIEGAVSGLAMGLTGVITAFILPLFNNLFY